MLADIDDACTKAGIIPDAFFSGHAHSIQRYTRTVQFAGRTVPIPYVVTGCGGHGGQTVDPVPQDKRGNPVYEFSYKGWGYTTVQISAHAMTITSHGVDPLTAKVIDSISVNLV